MQEVGAATLRLLVHRVREMRERAIELGANPDWVKPIAHGQGGGGGTGRPGMMSFRGFGFSTSRMKRGAKPPDS